jgi:hypothetical protein
MAVKVAATAQRSSGDPPASWEAAREKVLRSGPAEEMAKAVVSHLQSAEQATAEEIAAAVGAAGKDDSILNRAMRMAQDDGYIRRVGVTFRGIKWDKTEWADLELLDAPHIRQLEQKIIAFVSDFGLASIDHISSELGLEDDAPELRSALERAIFDETAWWYCNGIYGLPPSRLEGFEPKRDLWAETKPATEGRELGGALDELESAVKSLARAMGVGDPGKAPVSGGAEGQSDDPYAVLRIIQELHDEGVLTDEEFAAKKTELLKRI